ncbi:MAG: acyl-CoA synthetase [Gammaproteobacteria bacterium]|nr:acyl-CoA synthetase [Gammaproteobacteria bacterium]NIR84500.1 acyl-CoA synthetase [Gammaproteobacteria bacterium]NIR90403.1 acyl-CoA synthetase [Gammaproteobacteria bacterium]NIU05551.1 acyl-CoA synthetase [Gammaproteobacteria bacterium]NIV52690.1 AMP-binding protein [Gammaproteobacteria bacterium]
MAKKRRNPDPSTTNMYEQGLDRGPANYSPLTPLSFLERSAAVYPEKPAVIHGEHVINYREFLQRCRLLASALALRGVRPGDTISIMAPNVPPLLEAHYGVPMTGAVLNALNYRLDANTVRVILEHANTKVLITDREFSETIRKALDGSSRRPLVIDIDDPLAEGGDLLGEMDYETFLGQRTTPDFPYQAPADEWQAITLNYTSGTTGEPKGVVYHHRGAYLNALGNALVFGLNERSVYLWTLPMFHCNGWTYTWAVTAAAATHVCLRKVDAALIFPMIQEHGVTHMCGAPVVLNMLIHAPADARREFDHAVEVATGGAAPPSRVISRMESMGFRITHLYGLTETYGPATVCAWQPDWDQLDLEGRAGRMARQGVAYPTLERVMVGGSESRKPVPQDGQTLGEVMIRGNTVMKGYLKNRQATDSAFAGGWFHTGDLAVRHPDGYVEIKDRAKDIIISGGENISSLEVEEVLYKHPSVMEAAVVAKADEYWGETPCAFVTLSAEAEEVSTEDVIAWCREHLAGFKVPKTIVFGPLPKTSTGKIQKFTLRERAKELGEGDPSDSKQ